MFHASKAAGRRASATRNPQRTRERLLWAAFREVHRSGFRGADLETILRAARVTKGALYHHFENKEALGYAVVDEVLLGIVREKWVLPLRNADHPIDAIIRVLRSHSAPQREELVLGCPLNNLAHEMSPLDEGFRTRVEHAFAEWHEGFAAALRDGQKRGLVRRDVDPDEIATFLIAAFEGFWSLAKNSQDARLVRAGTRSMIRYLETLRAVRAG